MHGHPFMIDVIDCDVRLPAPVLDDGSGELSMPLLFMGQLVKLSILLGKILKLLYGWVIWLLSFFLGKRTLT